MPCVIQPRQLLSQPMGLVSIDWNNPITRGLLSAPLPHLGIDAVTRKPLVMVSGPTRDVGKVGIGLKTNGSSSYAYSRFNRVSTHELTLFGLLAGSGASADKRAITLGNSATTNTYHALGTGISNAAKMRVVTSGSGVITPSTSVETSASVFDNSLHSALLMCVDATLIADVDGIQDSSAAQDPSTTFVIDTLAFGALVRTSAAAQWDGTSFAGAAWARSLIDSERKSMHANPWQIFKAD